ncbi:MAG: hypothetical protein ABIL09_11035 [Gemmatimonadota bacterium]
MTATPLEEWADAHRARHREKTRRVLTRQRHRAVVRAVERGDSEEKAVEAAGVDLDDLNAWVARGIEVAHGKYHEFAQDLDRAQAVHTSAVGLGPLRSVLVPLRYTPHELQQQLHALQLREYRRIAAACCGRRGGKTRGGAAHYSARVQRDLEEKLLGLGRWLGQPHHAWELQEGKDPEPLLRYAVVAPTYALLDEPRIDLRQSFGRVETGGVIVHQTDHVWWLVGGIRIDFLSGDIPERLVSHGYDGVWFDEAARLKPKVWRDNMRPTLSDRRGWALFTTTPTGKNWFWSDIWCRGDADAAAELSELEGRPVEEILDAEFGCVAWTTADNTTIPHLVEEMESARRQMPDALFRRNYHASFDAFEGQCFDLIASRHRLASAPARRTLGKVWAGFDRGMTHRGAFCIVAQLSDGTYAALDCRSAPNTLPHSDDAWRRRDQGDQTVWTTIAYHMLVQTVGPDMWHKVPVYLPHDATAEKRYFRLCGFYVLDAFQEHDAAVTWTQVALHNGQLRIGSRVLWRSMSDLHFPGDAERSSKLWVDKDDDEWDSFRYAASEMIKLGEMPAVPMLKRWMGR